MNALAVHGPDNELPPRTVVQRVLDSFAEFLMRQELRVISRDQTARADITSVDQPSNTIERSSTNP